MLNSFFWSSSSPSPGWTSYLVLCRMVVALWLVHHVLIPLFNSGWYAFGSLCRSLFLFVGFCSLCLIRIVLMFVGGRCKIVEGWFFNLVRCAEHCRSGGYYIKLNIHPNLNYLYCTEKFIIITTSTANSLHGITTSIKWNQPSRCFRWRQQLLLPNLEKQLETTPNLLRQ
ncbi:hypothetical protein VPH35_110524 [Triticum aestivum]